MVPYLTQPCVQLGPLRLCAFGFIVAASVVAGLALGRRRFQVLDLDQRVGESMAWYAIGFGFVGAHVFSVLFYSRANWPRIHSFSSSFGRISARSAAFWGAFWAFSCSSA